MTGGREQPIMRRAVPHGQAEFGAIFAKLAAMDFPGWAVLEWERALKDAEVGAREGAAHAFGDFAASGTDEAANRRMLRLERPA